MSSAELGSNRSRSRGSNPSRPRARAGTGGSRVGQAAATAAAAAAAAVDSRISHFEPCAATASLFLYAQGAAILCLHHDTLALERRFQRHAEPIVFIAVDNVSERGAGRQVVSYDAGQTAIVWDLGTGEELARFASYDRIRVAAWMRNGNVAFGGFSP